MAQICVGKGMYKNLGADEYYGQIRKDFNRRIAAVGVGVLGHS